MPDDPHYVELRELMVDAMHVCAARGRPGACYEPCGDLAQARENADNILAIVVWPIVHDLRAALLTLWAEMPAENVRQLRPRIREFCAALHEEMEHAR